MMRTTARRFSKRLASVLMAGVLAAGMIGVTAFAETKTGVQGSGTAITSVDVKKIVKTDGNTYAPNTTFEFEVTPATVTAGEKVDTDATDATKGNVVYNGVQDGLKFNTGAAFSPTEGEVKASYEATGKLTVDASKFSKAGVYKYTVTEKNTSYQGINKDKSNYTVYVYVYANTDGSLYVGYVSSYKQGDDGNTKADLSFTNNYGDETIPDPDPDHPSNTTHDIEIKKEITGNMANKSDQFKVEVTVTTSEEKQEYYKVVTSTIAGATNPTVIKSGEKATFTVTNDTTIHIYGLTKSDKVTIKETDENVSSNGYKVSYQSKIGDTTNYYPDKDSIENLKVTKDGSTATITNTKNASTPTGIILTYAPYILMIALAGAMAFFFLRRRNEEI